MSVEPRFLLLKTGEMIFKRQLWQRLGFEKISGNAAMKKYGGKSLYDSMVLYVTANPHLDYDSYALFGSTGKQIFFLRIPRIK